MGVIPEPAVVIGTEMDMEQVSPRVKGGGGAGGHMCAGDIQPDGTATVIVGGIILPHLVVGQYDIQTNEPPGPANTIAYATPHSSAKTFRASVQPFGWRFEFKDSFPANPADSGFSFAIDKIA